MENGVMMQYFEWYLSNDSHLWKLLKKDALHLKEIGITAVWMPPAFKGIGGINDVGYGVYDIYDLGEFDQKGTIHTKYGTKDEYIEAIEALHRVGIQAYGDIVLNHKMGADATEIVKAYEVSQNNKNQIVSGEETIEVPTVFTFPGRHGMYSDFTWDWTCFNGIDYDVMSKRHATFLFKDKQWDRHVDIENGNFDYLMGADIDFSNSHVVAELEDWAQWYLNTTQLDGFRLDAVKHIDAYFYKDWIRELRQHYQKELFAVGEYWHGDVSRLLNYLNQVEGEISLFDVPLHYHFYEASYGNGQYDMSQIFNGTLVQLAPNRAVTFVDNHDTQPSQGLQSWVADWFKPLAYAFILLRKDGYPCLFYGDYYGIEYSHISAKRDLLDKLLYLRKKYAFGEQKDYFDDNSIIGWVRAGSQKGALVCLMSDSVGGEKVMNIGKKYSGHNFYDYLGNYCDDIIIDENGNGLFAVHGGSVSVYIMKEENNG
ncbi:alpha-amylase [Candidatus Stoquefichus massiliensis]|uniref:alpha-amylase n=1 Tax=Candidatus Stoquefichus massiliensis TaxID=1470350 RepID=UPI000484C610|nr:alpha-amylase [Candidatus Stoquefichus massiliensis]